METTDRIVDPAVFTVDEAARYLRMGRSTLYVLMGEGAIASITHEGSRTRRITKRACDRYLAKLEREQRHYAPYKPAMTTQPSA